MRRAATELLAAARPEDGEVHLLVAPPRVERWLELAVQGQAVLRERPAHIEELQRWTRYSEDEVLRTRDGMYIGSFGLPALPRLLSAPLYGVLERPALDMAAPAARPPAPARNEGPYWRMSPPGPAGGVC